jgi:hypothetical protein
MSTDPYPEVSGDESGIVPPQSGRSSEWPKKLRTLTATELDRLTIDGNGRFYWDGKLVNYEPPTKPKEQVEKREDVQDRHSEPDLIERAVQELHEQKSPEVIEGAELPQPIDAHHVHREETPEEPPAVDLDMVRPSAETAISTELVEAGAVTQMIRASEHMRLKFSRWQSLGAILVVLGILVGATGMAAYGFVAAHDWGCRAGLVHSYCPAPATRPAARTDIPA